IPQSMLDPTALKALEFVPQAGNYFINGGGQLANYVVNRFVGQDETRYQLRMDHQVSNNNRLSGRFTQVPAVGVKGFGSEVNGNSGTYSTSRQVVITDTHIFSPTFTNEVRVNYTRGKFSEDFSPEFSIKGGRNLSTELGLPSLTEGGLPLFNVSADGVNAFASIGSSGSTNNFNVEERYNISDIAYWNRGNMSWKFGLDVTHARLNVIPFFAASGGRWNFRVLNTSNNRGTGLANGGNVWASYLMGVPNSVDLRPVLIPYYYRWNSGAAFAQNDWKVRPNLTLNLGLRYSLQLPRTEKHNLQGVFEPDLSREFQFPAPVTVNGQTFTSALVPPFAYAGRGGRSKYLFPIEYTDFEPRFGFAWNLRPRWMGNRDLVIRGGYGLSHAPLTGNNRLPNPDFGATTAASTLGLTATNNFGSTGAIDPTYAVRLSSNVPYLNSSLTPDSALRIPADGLVYLDSLAIPGFAIAGRTRIPYVQNWNLTLTQEIFRNTVVEVSYVGSKGTHLFLPLVNLNPRDFGFVEGLESAALAQNSDTIIRDPLGRRDLSGNAISVQLGALGTQYPGFNHLYGYYNSSGNSIRHATYVSLQRRVTSGFFLASNYTFGKSIDDASDASPDKNVLANGVIQGGSLTFGAPRSADRAISAFDIKHAFNVTAIYDLPFGQGRRFLSNSWKPVQTLLGGWKFTSAFRVRSGFPFIPVLSDTNRLSADLTHTVRPDLVPGVPLKNPRWTPDCRTGARPDGTPCEPYVNPAAFQRPAKGTLGNAPRTLDIRGPRQRYFDVSIQKDFPLGADGKRKLQFRVDMLNAFNHPNFAIASGTLNSANDFMGLPVEYANENGRQQPITMNEYDVWARFNGQPLASTPEGFAKLTQVRAMVNAYRLPVPGEPAAGQSAALPANFFQVKLPGGFASSNMNAYDITSLNGFKLYRLRQAYGNSFGSLRELGMPRYVQFGIKFTF
ncbi:MAG TPA: hypothetical protein VJ302_02010, partial [Blastocatellia bacterium]|nr:hypothetical protein [Blastocatellia bacterium]